MVDWIEKIDSPFLDLDEVEAKHVPAVSVSDLEAFAYNGQTSLSPWEQSFWDGGKFAGGFGTTQIQLTDYWTLRQRSIQLFTENLYAAGLIKRLITNEINTGLSPESTPDENILGFSEDWQNDWSELVETRHSLWAKNPKLCDWYQLKTFGALQRVARMEALIAGDCLVVLRQNQAVKLPAVQLVSGGKVQTPLMGEINLRRNHTINHGVEKDPRGRVVAYWVLDSNGEYKRIPAYGEKSGRKIAWLIYGTDKRYDEDRGTPLLSLVLQSLKEIDRYRDSVQRKAVINSILAMVIKKTNDKPGTLPIQGGAKRRSTTEVTDSDGKKRKYNIASHLPGLVIDELQQGEEPVLKGGEGTDINFGAFEEAIIQAVAWANEIPPEILRLAFSNNYSASQAAINEFKIYLNKVWTDFGETFCSPIYVDWLIAEALTGKIDAPGFLESWRSVRQYDIYGAWVAVEWYGSIKPSTDMLKQAKGSKMLIDEGWSTNAREARITTGTKFSKNIKRLKRENQMKAEIRQILAPADEVPGEAVPDDR